MRKSRWTTICQAPNPSLLSRRKATCRSLRPSSSTSPRSWGGRWPGCGTMNNSLPEQTLRGTSAPIDGGSPDIDFPLFALQSDAAAFFQVLLSAPFESVARRLTGNGSSKPDSALACQRECFSEFQIVRFSTFAVRKFLAASRARSPGEASSLFLRARTLCRVLIQLHLCKEGKTMHATLFEKLFRSPIFKIRRNVREKARRRRRDRRAHV